MSENNLRNHEIQRTSNSLKNNDPLAHVDLLARSDNAELAEYRMYVEYVTDMGERLAAQPFKKTFEYSFDGNNLVSSTGVYLNSFLENGYQAALNDVRYGGFNESHAVRAKAFCNQLSQIRQWFSDEQDMTHKMYVSLCPPKSELNEREAAKQGFKQDRLMASIQLYEKTQGGIRLHAFSLDGLSLARLNQLHAALGLTDEVAGTTIEQLMCPLSVNNTMPAAEAVESIIYYYDKLLLNETGDAHVQGVDKQKFKREANAHVEEHVAAYDLYRQTIIEVANSLNENKVNYRLRDIVNELQLSIVAHEAAVPSALRIEKGQFIDREAAGGIIDYLRTKAIPHYLTAQLDAKKNVNTDTGYQAVSDAGGQAVASNITYEGACPTSNNYETAQNEIAQLGLVFGRQNLLNPEDWVWTTGKCVVANCPTKPGKTTVGPCSVCVGCQSIYDAGKDPKYLYKNKSQSIIEIFSELFSDKSSATAA